MKKHRGSRLVTASLCLVSIVALVISFFPAEASAEFPERPITIYISMAPGGSVDICTRSISAAAEKTLGKPIIIENRAGGGGTVAYALVANAKPDGYTLCGGVSTGIVRAPQMQKVTFKPLKSFTPLIAYAKPYNGIVVKNDAPWKTFKELIEYAKKNPNKIKYGTGGIGTAMHHAMAFVEHQDGIKWIHVPYKGNADALTALLGGHVDAASVGPEWVPFVKSGTMRLLAVTEEKRNPNFADVPTLKDLGYDFANETVFCIVGPAGLPQDIANKLEAAFTKAAESKEVKVAVEKLDLVPILIVGKDYDEYLKRVWSKLEKNLKETGLVKEPATSPY
ncbi:MAG TPA: tripartite tricarboxylate transporter substrate binding protein [Syntrophorhabdales bacterium]|nr:tripartite tricarboxylate transporter substrate binding protein [Syntrophorhabdales bacterium]